MTPKDPRVFKKITVELLEEDYRLWEKMVADYQDISIRCTGETTNKTDRKRCLLTDMLFAYKAEHEKDMADLDKPFVLFPDAPLDVRLAVEQRVARGGGGDVTQHDWVSTFNDLGIQWEALPYTPTDDERDEEE